LCNISWPQRAVHTAQEQALLAAGLVEAMPGPWRQRIQVKHDGTVIGSTPQIPPAEAGKQLLQFTAASPKHN